MNVYVKKGGEFEKLLRFEHDQDLYVRLSWDGGEWFGSLSFLPILNFWFLNIYLHQVLQLQEQLCRSVGIYFLPTPFTISELMWIMSSAKEIPINKPT